MAQIEEVIEKVTKLNRLLGSDFDKKHWIRETEVAKSYSKLVQSKGDFEEWVVWSLRYIRFHPDRLEMLEIFDDLEGILEFSEYANLELGLLRSGEDEYTIELRKLFLVSITEEREIAWTAAQFQRVDEFLRARLDVAVR